MKKKILKLQNDVLHLITSYSTLFQEPQNDNMNIIDTESKGILINLKKFILSASKELDELYFNPECNRLYFNVEDTPDSITYLNQIIIIVDNKSISKSIEDILFEFFLSKKLKIDINNIGDKEIFYFQHANIILSSLGDFIKHYLSLLKKTAILKNSLKRLLPFNDNIFAAIHRFDIKKDAENFKDIITILQENINTSDIFSTGNVFRHIDGKFYETDLNSIRQVEDFYGYHNARNHFKNYFAKFANGQSNYPLFITSLPGLGKTHFTISYALHNDELTLILPNPIDLEKNLEKLILQLSKRANHKFVLFFDDIDTNTLDWYYFRTHIGGSFVLPDNIIIVIASNYKFPANISSRGSGFTFPMFDEIKCQEMIEDYLRKMRIRQPSSKLISIIAADYVEDFGQKLFEELSPRTLVRYLDKYKDNINKRKKILNLSREDLILRPDPQIFFETNVKLMKSLYGEDALKELQEQQFDEI